MDSFMSIRNVCISRTLFVPLIQLIISFGKSMHLRLVPFCERPFPQSSGSSLVP